MSFLSGLAAKVVPGAVRQPNPRPRTRGDEIRARIEANRRKRLAIGAAMKAEAGVVAHNVWADEFAGLAELDIARIHSPEGRNMRQLYIVAHECGHIFLHGREPGRYLPTHVMELEAETYAHHAFRFHGMRVAREHTIWAREYVGSWVEKDRALGIPIDPRAIDFVQGRRSPYALLRDIPQTWKDAGGQWDPTEWPVTLAMPEGPHWTATVVDHFWDRLAAFARPLRAFGCRFVALAGWCLRHAISVALITGLVVDIAEAESTFGITTWPATALHKIYFAIAAGLVWACIALSLRVFMEVGTNDRDEAN